jgi:cobalt/nickel transport system ATP-binding protein
MDIDNSIIRIENVSYFYYDKITALVDISMDVKEGDLFAIIGANGCGKSTLLHIMDGLLYPSTGNVYFKGKKISKDSLKDKDFLRYFRERVGYVFQDSDTQLFCPTVLDELLYGPLQLGINKDVSLQRAHEIMDMLDIGQLEHRQSYMLSDGEKKKVAIGSILTINPEVLLFDEPTNGLDPRTQAFVFDLILTLHDVKKTIVIATHDLSFVNELNAMVAVFSEEHRIIKMGNAEEILKDEALLLKANLIHEHKHYHGNKLHSHLHSHYLFHKHDY